MRRSVRTLLGGGLLLALAHQLGHELFSWGVGHGLDMLAGRLPHLDLSSLPVWAALRMIVAVGVAWVIWFKYIWPEPSREERRRMLAARANAIIRRIEPHRHPARWTADTDPLDDVVRDGLSLLISFQKERLAVPPLRNLRDERRIAFGLLRYLKDIAPLLRDGHIRQARAMAPDAARDAEAAAGSLVLPQS